MDVEQPIPASTRFDPEHPYEGPDWGIEEAAHDAAMTAAHFKVLVDTGIAPKRAERLTGDWMALRHAR